VAAAVAAPATAGDELRCKCVKSAASVFVCPTTWVQAAVVVNT
jgi:hypothetical protein